MGIKEYLFIILTILVGVLAFENKITAPDKVLYIGDFELFSCQASSSPNLKWIYHFKDTVNEVTDSDILLDRRTSEQDSFFRKSLIRVPQALQSISCYDSSKQIEIGNAHISVNEFHEVSLLDEPVCEEVPKITLARWDQSSSSRVWLKHYVTNEDVNLQGVSGVKLTCISSMKVNWTITRKELREFRYWSSSRNGCYFASLVLSPINPTSAQKFTCTTNDDHNKNKKESRVNILLPPTRYSDDNVILDFNKTQECIEFLGTTVFGSQTLGWTTAGSSLLSIGMMVGIVFLKKQLEKQKTTNGNSSAPNQGVAGATEPTPA